MGRRWPFIRIKLPNFKNFYELMKDLIIRLVFFVPLENFSLIWSRHHYWWRALNFDLCSAIMAIEQWGLFSVPHLLWHRGIRLWWSSPRTRDIHTYCRAFGSESVTTSFNNLGMSRLEFKHPTFCMGCKISFFFNFCRPKITSPENWISQVQTMNATTQEKSWFLNFSVFPISWTEICWK